MKLEAWQTKVRPILTRICCEPIKKERVSSGGIHLPDGSYERGEIEIGRVFAVGPGDPLPSGEYRPLGVEPGDCVVFVRMGKIQDAACEGHNFWCVDERDVLYRLTEVVDEGK